MTDWSVGGLVKYGTSGTLNKTILTVLFIYDLLTAA